MCLLQVIMIISNELSNERRIINEQLQKIYILFCYSDLEVVN